MQIDEFTARLRELDEEIESLSVTRKTLLALPPTAPEPTEEPPALPAYPAYPAYQQILGTFGEIPGPKRARDLCQALDLTCTNRPGALVTAVPLLAVPEERPGGGEVVGHASRAPAPHGISPSVLPVA
ncbi:hypothetical protein ACGF12_35555 [Kitasatospora sp. NPDC048296]|uniref:hypothetical protein n=1 Tax=Kitasatospora sp. NPDC048296 TaxID=3364048 RepID=UPI0037193A1C